MTVSSQWRYAGIRRLLLPSWLLLSSTPLAATELKLCYEAASQSPNLPLYQVGTVQVAGLHAALTVAALQQQQVQYQLQRMPWLRCLKAVSAGQLDAAIGVGWTAERAAQVQFPLDTKGQPDEQKALLTLNYHIYTKVDSPLRWDGQQLQQLRYGIAAPKGFITANKLAALGALAQTDAEIDAGLLLTLQQRIDGFVLAEGTMDPQLQQHKQRHLIKKLQPAFFRQSLYLVFSQRSYDQHSALIQQLWQQLPQLKQQWQQQPPPKINTDSAAIVPSG